KYTNIQEVKQASKLGIFFDKKLTFGPHCREIKRRTIPRLNIIRTLAQINTPRPALLGLVLAAAAVRGGDFLTRFHRFYPTIRSTIPPGRQAHIGLLQNQSNRSSTS
uniref:Uncharacterized protein n=1 Tax=Anopheles arabiensis TaxID=7173 RepID=A0A182IGJ2_ANOAR